ncbi:MAG: FMN-binding glutamate synthase family protein [Mariprofundus sp.]|nr:FMN-binding glutamate synthase family protein [Mariprofundus sp.]
MLLTLIAIVVLLLVALGIWDFRQEKHTILRNYPVIGHARYILEKVGPGMRQYWVTNDKEEQPFNRDERSWVYRTAKKVDNHFGFGTTEQQYGIGYPIIKHAAFPFPADKIILSDDDPTTMPCMKVMGEAHGRKRPFRPKSIINVSAMSYGALGKHAISALNLGAAQAGAYHTTGEGGISPFHLLGADVIWQLGTGYFGARDASGAFSLDVVCRQVKENPQIRAIEIKLSQGAKPGKGGVLPGAKVTAEIAKIRGIAVGEACISPASHSQFHDVDSMIAFIERVADATGLPVGIKSAVGEFEFWDELSDRMIQGDCGPDFIVIDGSEGGTGAAPLTYSDHVSLPFKIGFSRVYQTFQTKGIANDVVWIGSGKLGFPDRAVIALSLGCDCINIAREAMLSLGCIQSQACHTGHCPTGITTMDPKKMRGLVIDNKATRLAEYLRGFREELYSLAHSAGLEHPGQFRPDQIEVSSGVNVFETLEKIMGYAPEHVPFAGMASLLESSKEEAKQ